MNRRFFLNTLAGLTALLIPFSKSKANNPDKLPVVKFDGDKITNVEELFAGKKLRSFAIQSNLGFDDYFTRQNNVWLNESDKIITGLECCYGEVMVIEGKTNRWHTLQFYKVEEKSIITKCHNNHFELT